MFSTTNVTIRRVISATKVIGVLTVHATACEYCSGTEEFSTLTDRCSGKTTIFATYELYS